MEYLEVRKQINSLIKSRKGLSNDFVDLHFDDLLGYMLDIADEKGAMDCSIIADYAVYSQGRTINTLDSLCKYFFKKTCEQLIFDEIQD